MDVLLWFRFGPVHTPLWRRKWKDGPEIEISKDKQTFNLKVLRPIAIHTHHLDEFPDSAKVADAYIPIIIRCELTDTEENCREIAEVVIDYLGPLIEELRQRTKQAHLRLRQLADLDLVKIQSLDGIDIPDLTVKYQQWFRNQERDRPLPYLEFDDWQAFLSRQTDEGEEILIEAWATRVPLYESLLLDGELEAESDARIGVLYAALACEIFIQSWLAERAKDDLRLRKWLDAASQRVNPESSVSLRAYYDLGLYLATERSLKEEKPLWSAFNKLVEARNNVTHRGCLPDGYEPAIALDMARKIINWVRETP